MPRTWSSSAVDGERKDSSYPEGPCKNYRPIACLPIMWKLLTGIFAEQIYDHLKDNNLLLDEHKGCRKRSRGTEDQLLIDKAITLDAKRRKRCLNMGNIVRSLT